MYSVMTGFQPILHHRNVFLKPAMDDDATAVHRVAVFDAHGVVVNIVSQTDVIRYVCVRCMRGYVLLHVCLTTLLLCSLELLYGTSCMLLVVTGFCTTTWTCWVPWQMQPCSNLGCCQVLCA